MMSNINNNTTAANKTANPLAKDAELKAFESSFFPAGGSAKLAIPQAPPAPKTFNNVRSRPMALKTRNWGNRSDSGFSGLNRSLYELPNVFYWDSRRPSSNNSRDLSNLIPSSISSTSSSSSHIPQAPPQPQWNKQRTDNNLIKGKRLRVRNWGTPGRKGWSGMNKRMYNRKNGMNIELNVIINELWATQQPKNKGTTERGIDFQELAPIPQEQYVVQPLPLVQEVVQPVRSSVLAAVTTTRVVPLAQPQQLNRGFRGGIPLSTNNTTGFPLGGAPLLSTASILTTPSVAGSRIPTKKELRTQQKLLKKQNKRDAKLMKKGKRQPTSVSAAPPTILRPLVAPTIVEPILSAPLSNNTTGIVDRGYTSYGGVATTTGIIGPVSTTVLPSNNTFIANNFNNAPFIKQEPAFINVPAVSLVGSPMM